MRCPNIPPSIDAHLVHSHLTPTGVAYKDALPLEHDNDFEGFRKQVAEHIYESPKFDRKEYNSDCYAANNQQTAPNSENVPLADKMSEDAISSWSETISRLLTSRRSRFSLFLYIFNLFTSQFKRQFSYL